MTKTTGWMALAAALALGAAGCEERSTTTGGTAATPTPATEEAVTPATGAEATGGMEQQAGSEQMQTFQTYRIDRLEGNEVILMPSGGAGEVQPQAGSEVRISKDEFQQLAGFEAQEGTEVQVQMGSDNRPMKIQKQAGGMEPSETPSQPMDPTESSPDSGSPQ